MSDEYAKRAQQARELLAWSSPAAARAMRAREREAARPRRTVEEGRWAWIDWRVRQSIEEQPRLVETSPSAPEVEVEDEQAERRRVSLARARMRARAYRQNDKS
ncbi:hypothetical protein [Nonomuraea gerenzanensis]|uniref:hypothetical protein n=1 Tax=Nonomuraea gerenzanensis TaxID=93944 RepID=UPI001CDA13DE|nr:hypothetical protein [Nonomuraea gerenzanensis]UBU16590.1 hypothetical protein LCN96_16710 [Nonomuraea gerenzanensis]